MKKIIYYNVKSMGLQNYCLLDKLLKPEYQTMVLHTDSLIVPYYASHIDTSWYKSKKEQIISGILCKDVSAYNGMKIIDILRIESPDLVVQMNVSHLPNRIITTACKRLGIKIIYMLHGAVGNLSDAQALAAEFTKSNKLNIQLKLKKIPKYIKLLREYHAASGNITDTLHITRQAFSSPFTFIWNPVHHHSLNVDKAFVYSSSDIQSLTEVFGITPKNIMAVGNPRLDQILSESDKKRNHQSKHSQLLYIEGCAIDHKLMSNAQQADILSFLNEMARKNGLKFVIRLHPGTNRENFIRKFGSEYQYSPTGESLRDSLLRTTITTGLASTALIESIAYRVPTISISWLEGVLQRIDVNKNDIGIVRKKSNFKKKLQEFILNGWMQEESRKAVFPQGEIPATKIIVNEIRKLTNA